VATLQEHLRLARAQNAYLHRELSTALKQAPLAASANGASDEATLRLENTDLRKRLATLTLHYTDLERRYESAAEGEQNWKRRHDELLRRIAGGPTRARESSLIDTPVELEPILKRLLALSHPDKWQGQKAEGLAHELTVVLNALREEVQS
jgi:hypothetical protein